MALGVALRYVLEALKKKGTKMYMFGLTALDRFKTRLVSQYLVAAARQCGELNHLHNCIYTALIKSSLH